MNYRSLSLGLVLQFTTIPIPDEEARTSRLRGIIRVKVRHGVPGRARIVALGNEHARPNERVACACGTRSTGVAAILWVGRTRELLIEAAEDDFIDRVSIHAAYDVVGVADCIDGWCGRKDRGGRGRGRYVILLPVLN